MSEIRVNSFVNQAVPSIAPDIKKDGEKNTANWKAYAAIAGAAIAGIAFVAGQAWSASNMSSDITDIKDLSQQVYSACASSSLIPELQVTVDKVRGIVVDVLADKQITNDQIIKAVVTFAQEIEPMLSKFPDASSVEIALLSASESLWVGTSLKAGQTNELIEQVFEMSCKELNVNCNELIQTLSNSFNNSTINEDARSFIDTNREDPCQYPYCENWIPPLPESIRTELREKGNKVLSIVVDVLANKKFTKDQIIKVGLTFAQEIEPMLSKFPDASSVEIALLSASEGIWKGTSLMAGQTNELIEQVFEKSCEELNVNCNELTQTLANRFNSSTMNEDVRRFIDTSRKDPCQYPYCENWIPPLPESIQPELREKANEVRSIILDEFTKNNITNKDRVEIMYAFGDYLLPLLNSDKNKMQTLFNASPTEAVLLAASDGIWDSSLNSDQCNDIIKRVFEESCKGWNIELDDFLITLVDKFNNPIGDESRSIIDYNRQDPCQYPYCENWTLPETVDSAKGIQGQETPELGLVVTECNDDDCNQDAQL